MDVCRGEEKVRKTGLGWWERRVGIGNREFEFGGINRGRKGVCVLSGGRTREASICWYCKGRPKKEGKGKRTNVTGTKKWCIYEDKARIAQAAGGSDVEAWTEHVPWVPANATPCPASRPRGPSSIILFTRSNMRPSPLTPTRLGLLPRAKASKWLDEGGETRAWHAPHLHPTWPCTNIDMHCMDARAARQKTPRISIGSEAPSFCRCRRHALS